jgi:hypothetical protein
MNLRETEWGGMDWINLAQNRDQLQGVLNMVVNISDSIKSLEIFEYLSNCWLFKKDSAPWS